MKRLLHVSFISTLLALGVGYLYGRVVTLNECRPLYGAGYQQARHDVAAELRVAGGH